MLFKQLCQALQHTIDYDEASDSAAFFSKDAALDFAAVCASYNIGVDVLDGWFFLNKTQYVSVFIVTPKYNPVITISLEKKKDV